MFTGPGRGGRRIVAELAPAQRGRAAGDLGAPAVLEGLAVGDSVAVNGACLTAVEVCRGRLRGRLRGRDPPAHHPRRPSGPATA